MKSIEHHKDKVTGVSFSPDGELIVSCSFDRTIKLYEIKNEVSHVLKGHMGFITSCSFSSCGNYVATSSYDNSIKIWDVEKKALIHNLDGHTSVTTSVIFSADG